MTTIDLTRPAPDDATHAAINNRWLLQLAARGAASASGTPHDRHLFRADHSTGGPLCRVCHQEQEEDETGRCWRNCTSRADRRREQAARKADRPWRRRARRYINRRFGPGSYQGFGETARRQELQREQEAPTRADPTEPIPF